MAAVTTVRQWFRRARSIYRPSSSEETEILQAIRNEEWAAVEFWFLLWYAKNVERTRDVRGHLWYLDGYTWRCVDCPATITSDEIDETEPPDTYDPECECRACRPCRGDGQ